jgi:two-component system response regulator CpxR
MGSENILLIDDDSELCELLTEYMEPEGFGVKAAFDGEDGLQHALTGNYDLVVLDVMLPRLNGFDVLRKLRKQSNVPVLMLTARGEDVDRIVGLEMGADDYLAKPFNPRELVARIRAILRRLPSHSSDQLVSAVDRKIVVGDIELDTETREVYRKGKLVELTDVEFNLLKELLKSTGEVISREVLVKNVLGRDFSPLDRSVDVHISNLRKKIYDQGDKKQRIKGVRGEGYLYIVFEESGD